ncbi:MAG TPA: hypothetical protein VHG28_09770, partial [Longimicrobiaceae bacterium]|nr:hypothetical protein [Longimicrobiaceae bacterium]
MLLFQEAAEAAHGAAEAASHGGAFHPTLLGWIVLLPLLGFLINGALSVIAARRALPKLPAVGDPYWDTHGHHPTEQEGLSHADPSHPAERDHDAHGVHDAHGAHDHHVPAAKPWTHVLPSFVAPGVLLASFAIAVVNWLAMRGFMHDAGEHPVFEASTYWSWMPVGELQVDAALLLDPLSLVMTLIVTGVGSLIHIFSVG